MASAAVHGTSRAEEAGRSGTGKMVVVEPAIQGATYEAPEQEEQRGAIRDPEELKAEEIKKLQEFKRDLESGKIHGRPAFRAVRDYLQLSISDVPLSGSGRTFKVIKEDLLREVNKRLKRLGHSR
jgi:hypothetical protein